MLDLPSNVQPIKAEIMGQASFFYFGPLPVAEKKKMFDIIERVN